ncbi:recombinase family protein [Methylobacterium sp. J-090]|uniref:recombinase family protein n=1 Tax=Methylobacterium sp. J-090 TaxID=2836666 RepID=UPI001FB9ADDD|nr:recombinase family protein [Methylobacterium sp. J-090]MCJ2081236.1 recombinase family protein [Methylobacterium sp. J-090]
MAAKAYSYIRFSRPEQMRGDSLRRQTEAAQEWAAEKGLVIDESLTDLGISAFRGLNRTRGALGKFLKLVEEGQIPRGSFLVIESLDRFSRESALDVLEEFNKLLKASINVVTLIDRQVYSRERIEAEPFALFGSLMVMMRAHEESKTKAVRLAKSWVKKRGNASTQVITARVPGWLHVVDQDGTRRIEFKPGEGDLPSGRDIVRRIFSETLRGYGKRRIATRLNEAKIPTFDGGKEWHASYIQKVLQNRAVLGEMQSYRRDEQGQRHPAGSPIRDYYPAAVNEAEFIQANATKASRTGAAGKHETTGVANLFRGLAFCSCGGKMKRINKGVPPKGAAYLTCAEAGRGACTNTRRWRIDWAENQMLGSTVRLDLDKVLAKATEEPAARRLTAADLEAKVEALKTNLANIRGAVEAGVSGYLERAIEISAEIEATRAELTETKRQAVMGAHEPSGERRRAMIQDLRARLAAASLDERADLRTRLAQQIRGTVKKVVFEPDRITATYKGYRMFGKVAEAAEVPVLLFSDNPDDLLDMAEMVLEPEVLERQDKLVAEFLRRARVRREAQQEAVPDEEEMIAAARM